MIKVALVKGGRSNQKKETESNSKLAVVEMKKAAKQAAVEQREEFCDWKYGGNGY